MAKRRAGRRAGELTLTDEERETLERFGRGRTVSQSLALRARIVLRCAAGERQFEIARDLGITDDTVRKWSRRFAAGGIEALGDVPKPNVHRKLADERVIASVARFCARTVEQTESRPFTDSGH